MIRRVVIVGAGGVGGCVACLLDRIEVPVHLVARGAHLRAMQEHGLTMQTPSETRVHRLAAAERAPWQEGDLALLCVKSQDTAEALQEIPVGIPVVCAQNGVENEELVARTHDAFGMLVWMMAVHLQPGRVALYSAASPGVLDVGAVSGDARVAAELAELLRRAGFESEHRPDIMQWKLAKLVSNLPGILELTGSGFDPALAEALLTEARAVLAKAEQPFTALEPFLARMQRASHAQIDGTDRPGGSLWQSKRRGSGSELGFLNGYIARLGARVGVATPVHDQLLAQAKTPGGPASAG